MGESGGGVESENRNGERNPSSERDNIDPSESDRSASPDSADERKGAAAADELGASLGEVSESIFRLNAADVISMILSAGVTYVAYPKPISIWPVAAIGLTVWIGTPIVVFLAAMVGVFLLPLHWWHVPLFVILNVVIRNLSRVPGLSADGPRFSRLPLPRLPLPRLSIPIAILTVVLVGVSINQVPDLLEASAIAREVDGSFGNALDPDLYARAIVALSENPDARVLTGAIACAGIGAGNVDVGLVFVQQYLLAPGSLEELEAKCGSDIPDLDLVSTEAFGSVIAVRSEKWSSLTKSVNDMTSVSEGFRLVFGSWVAACANHEADLRILAGTQLGYWLSLSKYLGADEVESNGNLVRTISSRCQIADGDYVRVGSEELFVMRPSDFEGRGGLSLP